MNSRVTKYRIGLLWRTLQKIRNILIRLKTYHLRKKVEAHKKAISLSASEFNGYSNVGFCFQFHNKGKNVRNVLSPFLTEIKAKNIIFFVDGCVDRTFAVANKLLRAPGHIIINRNNTHEISNYRMAAHIFGQLGCKYIVCLQDDDIYSGSVAAWVDTVINIMEKDDFVSIVGLNAGENLTKKHFSPADDGLTSSIFESVEISGTNGKKEVMYRLGNYSETKSVQIEKTENATNYIYCASVNRSPQIIRVADIIEFGYFPVEMEPYQYDDYYNCFTAWLNDRKCLLAPISSKYANIGIGGMRLFNNVSISNRPIHFVRNHNYIYENFGQEWNSVNIQRLVDEANRSLHN